MRVPLALVALAVAATGCTEAPITDPSSIGTLRVSVSTTGGDPDLDGYAITLDGAVRDSADVNEVVVMPELPVGLYDVQLTGVAENCAVTGGSQRSVTVTEGVTSQVAFPVTCNATGVRVTATTTGIELDPNGYRMSLDGGPETALGGGVILTRMAAGSHTVTLSDLAANCTVSGENPRTVTVQVGQVVAVPFAVTCVTTTGAIAITAATSGLDLPDSSGLTVRVDTVQPLALAPNGTVTLDSLGPGDHLVTLGSVPANCTVAGDNPRTVTVTVGGTTRSTAQTTFQITCLAATGLLEVAVVTSGVDYDLDGYVVQVDSAGPWANISVNEVRTIERLAAGSRSVALLRVASNCQVAGDNPRVLAVTAGGTTRDTVRTTFTVTCAATERIAFARGGWITVANADGSTMTAVADGNEPSWAPDGTTLAFSRVGYCDYYYGCFDGGVYVTQADGSGIARLTSESSDTDAAWRSDGARIAFARLVDGQYALYVMNADGSGVTRLTPATGISSATHPTWSADGGALAFTCEVASGNLDICVINADGTGLARVTSDTTPDASPAWKPDGSRIAFTTTRYSGSAELALMNADGTAVTRLSPGTGAMEADWAPDGSRIVFTSFRCDVYYGCSILGLSAINPDGTGAAQLTTGPDYAAAWRP